MNPGMNLWFIQCVNTAETRFSP